MSTATADSIRVLSLTNVTRYGEHHLEEGEIVVAHDEESGRYHVLSWDGYEAHDLAIDAGEITDEQEAREIAAEIVREAS